MEETETNRRQTDLMVDTMIVIVFALFALFFSLARWEAAYDRFVFLLGDAANIASFAAARNYPELFVGDAILEDLDNFRVYLTVHFPLLHLLTSLTGNYGTAFTTLLPLHVFTQVMGFYILGLVLFRHRYWAILLTLMTTPLVYINLGEFWGIYEDPIPRFSFQALLPYLLAAILSWGATPRAWPWFMAFTGLLVYVHPISTPAWGFAIWLSALVYLPRHWPWARKIGWMFFNGIIFVLVIMPFAWHYLGNYAHGVTANYEQVHEAILFRFEDFLDLPQSLRDFILYSSLRPYWIFAIGFGVPIVLWLHRDHRQSLYAIGWWVGGLVFVSIVLALFDQALARMLGRLPLQVDLVRGIRYLIPLMLIFCLWPFAELDQKFSDSRQMRRVLAIAGAVLVVSWGVVHPYTPARLFLYYQHCLHQGKLVCFQPGHAEKVDVLEAVRTLTGEQARLLVEEDPLTVRYYALRPVVYAPKDGGILAYSNPSKLLTWYDQTLAIQSIENLANPEERLLAFIDFARHHDAQYILLTERTANQTNPPGTATIYANNAYTLLKIDE